MRTTTLRVLVFLASMLFSAGFFWLAGFNFDRRGEDVAFFFALAIIFALLMATCPYLEVKA